MSILLDEIWIKIETLIYPFTLSFHKEKDKPRDLE